MLTVGATELTRMHRIPKNDGWDHPEYAGSSYCAVLASWIGLPGYSQSASGTPANKGTPPQRSKRAARTRKLEFLPCRGAKSSL